MGQAIVVMGVSGAGKSRVGEALAGRLGLRFVDADSLHDAAAVAKMRRGVALTDDDRWPWLDRVGATLAGPQAASDATNAQGVVVACSALRRIYRDRLRQACSGLRFVFLDGEVGLIELRMRERQGHYMPVALLRSQMQALERPGADEADVLRVDIALAVEDIVDQAARNLTLQQGRTIATPGTPSTELP